MKHTLLDMVQIILMALNSDEVNSWNDTTESKQVAQIIKNTYFEIIAGANLPEHNKLFALENSLDPGAPVIMYKPENVARIEWIDYDAREQPPNDEVNYRRLNFWPVSDFLTYTGNFNVDDEQTFSFEINDMVFKYNNDRAPTYYTVLEDNTVVFDSFDESVDSTLQASKMRCYGRVIPVFTLSNLFVPDLDDDQFPLLINEAKDCAFQELKQQPHAKAQQQARRGWRSLQRIKELKKPCALDNFADFGRRRP